MRLRPGFTYSVSSTTRSKRSYEVEGVHYHFLARDEFERNIAAGRFLEWAEVHGDLYGTDRQRIEQALSEGKNVLLDLDVNGGEHVQDHFPDSILIFLYPPSLDELRRRLRLRGSDDEVAIERRLSRYPLEKEKGDAYPFRLVNDNLEQTVKEILQILDSNS